MARTKRNSVKRKYDQRQVAFTRFMFIVCVLSFWMLGIGARLVHLQVNQHKALKAMAVSQRQIVKREKLMRGTIYDRDDRALAMSVRAYTLFADPRKIADPASAAGKLAKLLKLDAQDLARGLADAKAQEKTYFGIARKVDAETYEKVNKALDDISIKKAELPRYEGLFWDEDQRRTYPNQALASQVVGISDADDKGLAGIELSQNGVLQGSIVKTQIQHDRLGRVVGQSTEEGEEPGDVKLTLSASIQFKVEQALANAVKAANANSGMAVVMDPKTGEVLALANYPTFDPNLLGAAKPDELINRAVQNVYSPGSVFKIIAYGSGLEKRLFRPEDMIDAGNGTIEVANHRFRDSHHVGTVNYAEALAHSSNVCAIKTGLRVGKDDFFAMLQRFGFGAKTGIELPAETVGIVRRPEKWNGDSLASMSIGYEIGVTALQMTSAFATIANDGIRLQPRIIKEIRRPDQGPIQLEVAEPVRVMAPEAARDLRRMLKQVVLTGTGRRAQIDGYTAAGKTGTAWKFNSTTRSVDPSKYISSFIGMAPADDPSIVVGIVIDEPKVGGRDGGMVAAPVFKSIAEQVLPELGVRPNNNIARMNTAEPEIPEAVGPANGAKASEDRKAEAGTPERRSASGPAKNVTSQPGSQKPASKPEKAPDEGRKRDKRTAAREITPVRWYERRTITS